MNEQHMKSIITVAKYKSISRASEELHISQQGLSKTIEKAENELGVKVFTRTSQGMELTDFGFMVLPVVQSMLSSFEEHTTIINGIIEKYKETISISYEHSLLPYLIPIDLISKVGNIRVKNLIAGDIRTCISQVTNGTADFGFCHKDEDFGILHYVPLISEPYAVIMRRDHYLAEKDELVLSDLKDVPQLFPAIIAPKGSTVFLKACVKAGFQPNFVVESNNLQVLLKNVEDNVGVLLGSPSMIKDTHGDIIAIPLNHESLKVEIGFLLKPPAKKSILSFIDEVKTYYSRRD
jgi:DNA-binding transcriptional LysR family regulator